MIRSALAKLRAAIDANDVALASALAMLGYGLEQLVHGLGFAAAGGVLAYAALRKV